MTDRRIGEPSGRRPSPTDSRVDRLVLRCRGPSHLEQVALDVRRRLESVARNHLAEALARALVDDPGAPGAGERRVFVEQVELQLDLRPQDYDDVTLAVLWAARVRRAVEDLIASAGEVYVFDDDAAWLRVALEELVSSSRLSWLFDELPCGSGWVLPLDFLAACDTPRRRWMVVDALAGDRTLAARMYDRLMPHERRTVLHTLQGKLAWGQWGESLLGATETGSRPRLAPTSRWPRSPGTDAAPPVPGSSPHRRARRGRARHRRVPWRDRSAPDPTLAEWLAALREARAHPERLGHAEAPSGSALPRGSEGPPVHGHHPGAAEPGNRAGKAPPAGVDPSWSADGLEAAGAAPESEHPGWLARAGGLVFVHPWLGAYLEAASVGAAEPVGVRRRALADLVAPSEPDAVDDALVRLLAGDDLTAPAPPAPPSREDAVEAAAAVLSAFTALLPGFEESSHDFVRRQFLQRNGVARRVDEETVLVRLDHSSADLVLDRLPYPVSPFRLAWTPLFRVEVTSGAR